MRNKAVADDKRRRPAPGPDPRWAELADLVLIIAREIQFRGYADEQAIPLSQSEGMVMRYLLQDPGAPPSRIAAATGLQRTNLSTVLLGLERKGLIERRAAADDRRGVTVYPTDRGTANYALVRREWATAVASAAATDGRETSTRETAARSTDARGADARASNPAGSDAAGSGDSDLDAALRLLRAIEAGLAAARPAAPGRPTALM